MHRDGREHQLAGLVGRVAVDEGVDHPVVVAFGVVDASGVRRARARSYPPRAPTGSPVAFGTEREQGRPARVAVDERPCRARRSSPRSLRPTPSDPSRRCAAGRCARRPPARAASARRGRRASTRSTRAHMALRTITSNVRPCLLIGRGGGGGSWCATRPGTCSGSLSASHSSSSDESVWRIGLAQPLDQVVELGGAVCLGHGLAQRAVGVGEIAQHQPLGPGELVAPDEVGEAHPLFPHHPHDGLRRQRVLAQPRVPLAVDLVRPPPAARPAAAAR